MQNGRVGISWGPFTEATDILGKDYRNRLFQTLDLDQTIHTIRRVLIKGKAAALWSEDSKNFRLHILVSLRDP